MFGWHACSMVWFGMFLALLPGFPLTRGIVSTVHREGWQGQFTLVFCALLIWGLMYVNIYNSRDFSHKHCMYSEYSETFHIWKNWIFPLKFVFWWIFINTWKSPCTPSYVHTVTNSLVCEERTTTVNGLRNKKCQNWEKSHPYLQIIFSWNRIS